MAKIRFENLYRFTFVIMTSFYLAITNFILLFAIWWLNDSTYSFLEIFYLARKPVFRFLVGETIIFGLGLLLLFLQEVDHSSYSKKKVGQTDKNEVDMQDITTPAKFTGFMMLLIGGAALGEYFFGGLAWQAALLRYILFFLPITIASMVAFFLVIPIDLSIKYIGNTMLEKFRN